MMALYAQVHSAEGKPAPTPADFMPDFLTDRTVVVKRPELTPDEEQAELLRIAQDIGAVVVDADYNAEDEEMNDVDIYEED